MPNARRGEVWLVDLGMVEKVRPALRQIEDALLEWLKIRREPL